jgi:hypothetical protein
MLYTDFSRGSYFDGMVYAETILKEAQEKKKRDYVPELSYQKIVEKIGSWLDGWLQYTMPRPSELMDLYVDAFVMVMKAQRKPLTMENYTIFSEALRYDVMRSMLGCFVKYDDGIRTNYTFRKKRSAKVILKELKSE